MESQFFLQFQKSVSLRSKVPIPADARDAQESLPGPETQGVPIAQGYADPNCIQRFLTQHIFHLEVGFASKTLAVHSGMQKQLANVGDVWRGIAFIEAEQTDGALGATSVQDRIEQVFLFPVRRKIQAEYKSVCQDVWVVLPVQEFEQCRVGGKDIPDVPGVMLINRSGRDARGSKRIPHAKSGSGRLVSQFPAALGRGQNSLADRKLETVFVQGVKPCYSCATG